MDPSAASSFSDLEMDDYDLFPMQCHLIDDDQFISQDIASVLQGQSYLQPSLSCESYSSYNSCTAETSLDGASLKFKTTISEPSSSSSQLLSFDNSNYNTTSSPTNSTNLFNVFDSTTLKPHKDHIQYFSAQSPNGGFSQNHNFEPNSTQSINKPIPHVRDHIMAERKRREKLSQSFIALSALVPGLKKMDKNSVLGDAIKYVKELKERLKLLEEQKQKRKRVESMVGVKKTKLYEDDDEEEGVAQVEARVFEKDVLVRIHCQKQKGLLVKILSEIQNLHLFVVNSSVLPFGDSNLVVTIVAQMGENCSLTMSDLVKNLRMAILSV